MRRILLAVVFAFMLSSGFVSTLSIGIVQAYTGVSGVISSDMIWSNASGPYNLTGNVLIDNGVTVTVEANTVINLDSYYMRVNGTLIIQSGVTINMKTMDSNIQVNGFLTARGTSDNPIHINGAIGYEAWIAPASYSSISFSSSCTGWNDQTGSGSIIEHAIINSTIISVQSSVKFSNNIIDTALFAKGGSPLISNNLFKAGLTIYGGSPLITSNKFTGGYIFVYGENTIGDVRIANNDISGSYSFNGGPQGITFGGAWSSGGTVLIERNMIHDNNCGIWLFSPNYEDLKVPLIIQDNTIINNQQGITIQNRYSPPKISDNNIYNNQINIKLTEKASLDINAANNWWGTTDTAEINQKIYDYSDDFTLGKVNYTPILTASNPEAQPDANAPIASAIPNESPTSAPLVRPTPSNEPSQNPTPISTQSGAQTENPLNPDWGQIAIIILLGIVVILLVVNIMYKRRRHP